MEQKELETKSKALSVQKNVDFDTMQRMAKLLSSSTIVPKDFQQTTHGKNPEVAIANSFIAVNMAVRLQADPFMIMQNLYIVQSKPSFSSSFLIAMVNSCGRFEPIKFSKIEAKGTITYGGKNIPNLTCYAYTSEKGKDEQLVGTEISMQMAINEGWYQKTGTKWQTMPEQMLRYRAATFWARTYCPEILMGLHTTDEVKDSEDVDYKEIQTKANQGETVGFENVEQTTPQPEIITESNQQAKQVKPEIFNR